jgi:hypothetical protein
MIMNSVCVYRELKMASIEAYLSEVGYLSVQLERVKTNKKNISHNNCLMGPVANRVPVEHRYNCSDLKSRPLFTRCKNE